MVETRAQGSASATSCQPYLAGVGSVATGLDKKHTYNWSLLPTHNCTSWACDTWLHVAGESIDADGWFHLEQPTEKL